MDATEERIQSEAQREKYHEAMEECAAFMAKMIEKYGKEVLEELEEKKE